MNDTILNITGNLTADPERRFTPSGAAVANFTVAATPRKYDASTKEWSDGEPVFIRCNVWRQPAENAAECLKRGMRVMVCGRLRSRSWEDRETGAKRTALELEVDEIGASLKFALVSVNKAERASARASGSDGQYGDDEPPF